MMDNPDFRNRFLLQAFRGHKDPLGVVGAFFLTLACFLVLGTTLSAFPLFALVPDLASKTDGGWTAAELGIDPLAYFVINMIPFMAGWLGLWICSRPAILNRAVETFVTGMDSIRWQRIFRAAGVSFLMFIPLFLISYLNNPDGIRFTFEAGAFFRFLPAVLLLVPMQAAFEEVALRGQLLQTVTRVLPGIPLAGVLVSSMAFAMLHGLNPEIGAYGFWVMMSYYFTFGLILALIAVVDEGLEIPIAIHVTNNIGSFLFFSYEGSAMETPAMFHVGAINPLFEMLSTLLMVPVFYFIFLRRKKDNLRELMRFST